MDDTPQHSRSVIGVAADEYLATVQARRCSPRTVELYGQALRDFDRFLDGTAVSRVQDVTPSLVEQYRLHLQQREFSPAGEYTYCRAVKCFFDYLERRQQVFENPFAGVDSPAWRHKRLPVPTEEEIARLLAAPDVARPHGLRARALLEVAYGTAARMSELAGIQVGDLDLANGTVRLLGKGSRERVVPLGGSAVAWLKRYLQQVRSAWARSDTAALWLKANGRPLTSQWIPITVRRCARKARLPAFLTPHAIRRACASHMLSRGAHPADLQMLLGHASLRHLSQYLQVGLRELKAMHDRSRLGQ